MSPQRQVALREARRTALFIRSYLPREVIEELALGNHACPKAAVRRADGAHLGAAFAVIEGLARLVVLLETATDAEFDHA